jgi:hypothetical protein
MAKKKDLTEFRNLKPFVLHDSIFINVCIKLHNTMIIGLNTYEINNNELVR